MKAATTPAAQLLALLENEDSLETRSREDIDTDLSAHGIDPAGPVRLARRLAERSTGPADALLGAVIEDETAEAEIAALESADIAEVRNRLQAGTVAAVTAEARRRAGLTSKVVGIGRPQRGAVWAWTGSLVGMAACALIVVGTWWEPAKWFSSIELEQAATSATSRSAEMNAGPPTELQMEMTSPVASAQIQPTAPMVEKLAEQAPDAMGGEGYDGDQRSGIGDQGDALRARSQIDRVPPPEMAGAAAPQVTVIGVLVVEPGMIDLTALLVPDPASSNLVEGRVNSGRPTLSDRMAEARRLARGRPVLALLRLQLPDGVMDAALLRDGTSPGAAREEAMQSLLDQWFGDRAADYVLIALSSEEPRHHIIPRVIDNDPWYR